MLLRFLPLFLVLMASAQTRIIPHLTRPDGPFQTRVLLLNNAAEERGYRFTAYDQNGDAIGLIQGSLEAYEAFEQDAPVFFRNTPVSHFTIALGEDIQAFVVYASAAGDGSPAHVVEQSQQAELWRFSAGNWSESYDAIAVVNTGTEPTEILLRQISAAGRVIDSHVLGEAAPMAKVLAVTSQLFPAMADGYYEVEANQPLALVALRGDATSRFFWQNPAVPSSRRTFADPFMTAVQVTPEENRVEVGQAIQLAAIGTFSDGSVREVTEEVDWRSSLFSTASVDTGLVRGHSEGSVLIEAFRDDLVGSAPVQVIPASFATVRLEFCDEAAYYCFDWMPVEVPYVATYTPPTPYWDFLSFRMFLEHRDAAITAMEATDINGVYEGFIEARIEGPPPDRKDIPLEVGDVFTPRDEVTFDLGARRLTTGRGEIRYRIELDHRTIVDLIFIR